MNDIDIIAAQTIDAAAKHLAGPMQSSAEQCLNDARACFARDDFESATRRAVNSLEYSLGPAHPVYIEHAAMAHRRGVWGIAA